jgi:tRNA A-37 threonylcarbamoyl transferase component Bud32
MTGGDVSRLKKWVKSTKTDDIVIECFPYGIDEVPEGSLDIVHDTISGIKMYGPPWLTLICGLIGSIFILTKIPVVMVMLAAPVLFFCVGIAVYRVHEYLKQSNNRPYTLKPRRIVLSEEGIAFIIRTENATYQTLGRSRALIPWGLLLSISLRNSKATDTVAEDFNELMLRFDTKDSRYFELKLSAILTQENWSTLARVVRSYAPHAYVDGQIAGALAISSVNTSYTELWLESLATAPGEETFIPLQDMVSLLDGRYVIKSKLASGGQGTVYVAIDHTTNQEVVLKEYLLPMFVDEAARNRALVVFQSEVTMLKKVSHPKIVKLIDHFADNNRAFLVLNRISGVSLREFIQKNGPVTQDVAVLLLAQMCEILNYLHNCSPPVVHRDFTPENLLIDKDLQLTLIDFTIAQTSEGTGQAAAGKVAYMPPEQYRGEVNVQSDIYAMAGSLYFCLTGREPEPLRQLNLLKESPEMDPSLSNAILQSTEQDAARRVKSIDQLVSILTG